MGASPDHGRGALKDRPAVVAPRFSPRHPVCWVPAACFSAECPCVLSNPTPLMAALNTGGTDRILVLIRLDGGNAEVD
jgi:hypothetical protein